MIKKKFTDHNQEKKMVFWYQFHSTKILDNL